MKMYAAQSLLPLALVLVSANAAAVRANGGPSSSSSSSSSLHHKPTGPGPHIAGIPIFTGLPTASGDAHHPQGTGSASHGKLIDACSSEKVGEGLQFKSNATMASITNDAPAQFCKMLDDLTSTKSHDHTSAKSHEQTSAKSQEHTYQFGGADMVGEIKYSLKLSFAESNETAGTGALSWPVAAPTGHAHSQLPGLAGSSKKSTSTGEATKTHFQPGRLPKITPQPTGPAGKRAVGPEGGPSPTPGSGAAPARSRASRVSSAHHPSGTAASDKGCEAAVTEMLSGCVSGKENTGTLARSGNATLPNGAVLAFELTPNA